MVERVVSNEVRVRAGLKPVNSLFCQYIKTRITKNKNFLCCVVGSTGSGKSYASLWLAQELDPEFSIENVVFTPMQLMDLINSKEKTLKRGSVILCDEMGIITSHKTWMSQTNRLIHFLLQTFRHKNFILLMCVPHFTFIDASVRKLFHAVVETTKINYEEKTCKLKAKLIQVNAQTGKGYYKYLRVNSKDGLVPLKTISSFIPNQDLLKKYERKKTEFTRQLNEKISRSLDAVYKKELKQMPEDLPPRQAECLSLLKQKLTVQDIAKRMGNTPMTVYEHLKGLKNKGYILRPVKDRAYNNKIMYYEVGGYAKG